MPARTGGNNMCGIAGLAGLSPVNELAVGHMIDLMAHRGPDGRGTWRSPDGRVCLGHRRLAILDLSERGAQPMTSADGHLCITYNGELYNYVEIRERLKREGSEFRTATDTEVVIEAYRVWGEACLQEFNGMFAFAIHDQRRNVLFCARDRFGEKPFLYFSTPRLFAFASEYKALFSLAGVDGEADERKLLRFLHDSQHGLDHQKETIFQGLMKIKVVRKPATKARKGTNPFTGEEMMFKAKPARNVVKVLALKGLKDMV